MERFANLLKPFVIKKTGIKEIDDETFAMPGRMQDEAKARFPVLAKEAGLHLWSSDEENNACVNRLVIGIVTWSSNDFRLLDVLVDALPTLQAQGFWVEVFDADDAYEEEGDFNKRIPGIESMPVLGGWRNFTPIVGIWRDGELTQKAKGGYIARELVYDFLHNITGRDMRPPKPAHPNNAET